MSVKDASDRLGRELERAHRQGHIGVPEADTRINDASRDIVSEMAKESGEVWLALVNPRSGQEPVWKWDGGTVFNFGADMAFPRDDEEMRKLLASFRDAPNVHSIAAIHNRLDAIGGKLLLWG